MPKHCVFLCVSALAVLFTFEVLGFGQTPATMSGTVKDPSGAVVSNTVITLTNVQTSVQRKSVATAAGAVFLWRPCAWLLQNQCCRSRIQRPGKNCDGAAGEQLTLDLPLELAANTGTVSVETSIDPFNVVPDQATNSLFGLDKPLEEIPRSISIADSEMLTRYNVKTVNDIVTVSPGTFTGSYFGIPGSVFLRGDIGDNFFRGFRRVENRGNYQTPVAATDHIEIVKGPPPRSMAAAVLAGS